ncbi:MMPL family transporter [Bacillus sp. FJAT-49736]|uniref:MMPL family transporter n=1 Tax=Bacillus sp. FJAT-49736 TaxID=2833582 RepID=UPI001BC91E63|nr:MMPL family transporter [Bacillus sp. FJAT-49736]MBS4172319.1 MMPL family transporter [Bacillus sp. FJAT-49736]
MRSIVKFRWLMLALWIVIAVVLAWKAPNMENLVREKGQITVPDGYSSTLASKIKQRHSNEKEGSQSFIVVFHNNHRLDSVQIDNIEKTVHHIIDHEKKLSVNGVTTHFNQKELENQLVSKDGKTILVILDVDLKNKEIRTIREKLEKAIKTPHVDTMMTGNGLINEDVVISSQKGLKKTEFITVAFILIVLILVFRSVVAPIIPLFTVGLTYLVSQSVVAFLVDKLNFPLSNFTQIFLVAVLFGIGTDYCILLLSRFKEELSKGNEVIPSIITTYKTAGKTVLFSGIAVMIGFASIGFASFKLYQSASAVAVGVVFLLLALLTIVPFFMASLKKVIFWPQKGNISHSESKLWGWAGNLAITRPFIALGIVAIFIVPLLISYNGKLSFNSLDELGNNYESVKAFNIVSNSFGSGEIMPVTVVLENDESMKSKDYLGLIENISHDLSKVDHVEKIRSATRPVGDVMKELYVKNQAGTISKGIGQGNKGIGDIKNGLDNAAKSLSKNAPKLKTATAGIDDLESGTKSLQAGIIDLQSALEQIEGGIRSGSKGADDLKRGIVAARKQAIALKDGVNELLINYRKMQNGLGKINGNYGNIANGLLELQTNLNNLNNHFAKLEANYKGINEDTDYLVIKQTVQGAAQNLGASSGAMSKLNENLSIINDGFGKANIVLGNIYSGLTQFSNGFDPIIDGLDQLELGMSKAADGQSQIIEKLPDVSNGLGKIADGQMQLKRGFGSLDGQLSQLTDGLNQSTEGLGKIQVGLNQTSDFLNKMSNDVNLQKSGVYIPDELIDSPDYQKALDTYISKDGKMTTIDLILNQNPYSNNAMTTIDHIKQALTASLKGTKLENAHIGISGATSMNHDLNKMSDADYSRTVLYMLVGIGIILIILLRSLIMPVYLIISLLLTYYSSIAMTELVFVHILGYSGISWAVPFFGFVILMALGIDYSIFLMDRFIEYRHLQIKEGILLAMKNMGTVIISAAIILAGTFAAMLPSGVMSLLQIATLVLSGLLFYAFIVLPLFVPVLVKTLGKTNWWPFMSNK